LVVLRTFSKAMSMAGLRAGYLLAAPALVREVSKAKLPYNLNFVTETVAAEVLRRRSLLEPQVEAIRAERDRLYAALAEMSGLTVYPSEANFILFRVVADGLDHRTLFDRLLAEFGVLVRDVSAYPMLDGCLRVNAGTPEENDVFLAGMAAILPSG
jgi:histidinol-phosphate/aromatic aminotransferase/cobyric acid decarboxylase-like protein